VVTTIEKKSTNTVEVLEETLAKVILNGDLSKLSPAERIQYHNIMCDSVGLNPLTKPFEYLDLKGKLVLYATKNATDQLRELRKISIGEPKIDITGSSAVVTVTGTMPDGRTDGDVGVVWLDGLKGEAYANAIMKAHTKAKRRLTLSMGGLGMIDESEVDSIHGARRVDVDSTTGEVLAISEAVDIEDEYPYTNKYGDEVHGFCDEHQKEWKRTQNQIKKNIKTPNHFLRDGEYCNMPQETLSPVAAPKEMTEDEVIATFKEEGWSREDIKDGLGMTLTTFLEAGNTPFAALEAMRARKQATEKQQAELM
jgi:hypothetical protein